MSVVGKSTVSNKGKERILRVGNSDKGKQTVKPKPINKTQKVVPNVKRDVFTQTKSHFEKGETSGVKSATFYHKQSLDGRQNWIVKSKPPVSVDYIGKIDRSESRSPDSYVLWSDSEDSYPGPILEEVYVEKVKKPKTKKAWVSLFN